MTLKLQGRTGHDGKISTEVERVYDCLCPLEEGLL
jgi:hypothetical protein